jgi:hypothetical protein
MALITLSGYPCAGKSHRATQIKDHLEQRLADPLYAGPALAVTVLSDDTLHLPRSAYDGAFPCCLRGPGDRDRDRAQTPDRKNQRAGRCSRRSSAIWATTASSSSMRSIISRGFGIRCTAPRGKPRSACVRCVSFPAPVLWAERDVTRSTSSHRPNGVAHGTRCATTGGRIPPTRERLASRSTAGSDPFSPAWTTSYSASKSPRRWSGGTPRSLPCPGQTPTCPPTRSGARSPRASSSRPTRGHRRCVSACPSPAPPSSWAVDRPRADGRAPHARQHHDRARRGHSRGPIRRCGTGRHPHARRPVRAAHHPPVAPPEPLRAAASQTPVRHGA